MEKIQQEQHNRKVTKTYGLIIVSLFAALTAVFSQISIPIGPVPINLALLAVFSAGAILDMGRAVTSQVIFVLIGAVGVPVFAGFQGGASVLAGPRGGYIFGYILAAFVISLLMKVFSKPYNKGKTPIKAAICAVSILAGMMVCYTLGTAWFMISTSTKFADALLICVVPFLIGDAFKIAAATLLTLRLKKLV